MSEATGAPQEAVVCAFACFVAILARIAQAAAHHADNQEKGAAFDPEEEANSLSNPNGENEGKGAWLVLILVVIIIGCLIFFDYL